MSHPQRVSLERLVASRALFVGDGYRTRQAELDSFGYRIIRVADVRDGEIHLESSDFVSVERTRAIGDKAGREGDILLTTKGTVGRVAVLPPLDELVVYSPQMCFFRVAEGGPLVPQYFRYWLESREFKRQAFDCMGKTDMAAYINLADLRSLELTLPSINTQQSVITVLGAVDDKIAVNKRLSALLWKHLDALFDRAVLHRCVSRRLGELATFHNAKRVPLSGKDRERRRGQVPYYGATGIFGHVDTALFEEPLVLIGEDGSVVTAEGRPVVQYIWGPSWVNNHAHVLTGTSVSTEVLATAVRRQSVRHLITGAVQPKLSMGKLKALELQLPEGHALKSLESQCWREVALIRAIIEETRTLKMLREALLPGLMAGRLRVKDAEKQAEEVL